MVVTRAQAIQQLQEDTTTRSKEQQSGTQPHELLKVPDELASIGGEFDSEIFFTSRVKVQKTKREKRESRRQHHMATRQDSISESEVVGVSAAQLREPQQTDSSLSKVCQSADNDVDCSVDKPYFWQDGLLFHHWKPHGQELINVFARVGIPKKVLTDQGSNFTHRAVPLAENSSCMYQPISSTV